MTDPDSIEFHGLDPEYGLTDYMSICATTGDWSPGGLDNLVAAACYLEYVRRGGGTTQDAEHTRAWYAEHATVAQLNRLQQVGADLQAFADACDWYGLSAYLDREYWRKGDESGAAA
jgi:hypothetical protein